MASDDDIERLLREVEALESGSAARKSQPPAPDKGREVAKQDDESGRGRAQWAIIAALGGAALGFVIGILLPFFAAPSTALGAAIGAAAAALIGGAPGWYRKD